MNRRVFIKLAAVSPIAVATAPTSQTYQTSQTVSFDVAVIGGSTTGVFAAVRAAEKGMKVVLVENNALFGGTATAGFVPVWHSMQSLDGSKAVNGVGGLFRSQHIPQAAGRDGRGFVRHGAEIRLGLCHERAGVGRRKLLRRLVQREMTVPADKRTELGRKIRYSIGNGAFSKKSQKLNKHQ